ncbi:MAG: cation transporter [Methanobrevibacter sp.]|uniref:Cation transporter n=1 Tax=Methanobrevibacter millerae TaxID=230361 RepID=A0A8T3VAH8_9EURY|nr:cation diffusion facilitator family transporter [Methanobrevibacter millerae]MBE6505109.1 cation transporter [Methanobrevibacter millerae]MBR0059007.1 cation transporter [Methanobrevibacter sp.]MBR0372155.1 cation transporter [Methanobrevibacter sp.]
MDREKKGTKATAVAIFSNCFLTVLNIIVGLMCGSYALIAEGIHTFSDVITSIIAYIGFKIGQKPADEEHPRGYGRAEAISGLVIVLFLAIVGYEIIDTAKDQLLNPILIHTPTIYAAIMAVVGISINIIISSYLIKTGKEIKSPAIEADGHHQRTDIYSSIAILIGIVASNMGFPILDPIVGMAIGILILKTAYSIGKENINNILGKVPDKNLVRRIKRVVDKTPDAYNAHNIKIDNYGPYYIVNLHIQVDGDITVDEAHKIVHITEENIMKKIPDIKSVSVHACPLGLEYEHCQKIDKK